MQNEYLTKKQINEIIDFVCSQPLYKIQQFTRNECMIQPKENPAESIRKTVTEKVNTLSDFVLAKYYENEVKPSVEQQTPSIEIQQLNKLIEEYESEGIFESGKSCWMLDVPPSDLYYVVDTLEHIFHKSIIPDGGYDVKLYKTFVQLNLTKIMEMVKYPDINSPFLKKPM